VPEHTSAQHRQHAQQLWAVRPKWGFDAMSGTLGNRCAGRKILYKLFFAFIAIKFCMKLTRRWQERPKTPNCSNLVIVLVLRGFSQSIQFLLLGSGEIGAACAGIDREHLLVRLRRGRLKACCLLQITESLCI
jgi:hypothetical protein